ncbi:hypothetical protein OQJ15_15710 [Fluoribacter dumoffii]|uniref:Uncharacterized protein n=1 Tax=Fluoribacter dumoffii TaxID=463 RepID=A0A377GE50_9GAMM|nr:hypothetical protein [Fluoribacter dumoffii]KTC91075.1 hypothetical protein Ldum_2143 [Fluoribacter dumoffii NY 23]MCW8387756.1 hypothetical protein [Fluoribacter dumoffii]MCW8497959.1 hypothetical protein [Fluoribacter dumoffii]STO22771.1 Uncharacterised protein [Fluoribacter dumoffii]
MQAKIDIYQKKRRRLTPAGSTATGERKEDFTYLFQQFMRTDLQRQDLNKLTSAVYDRIQQELSNAEKELSRIQSQKGNAKKKAALRKKIAKKKKWIDEVDEAENNHFSAFWTAMLHGYRVDLVVNQHEHVRKQGLVVKEANEEFIRLLRTVLSQEISIEGKTYSASELKEYKNILNRFFDSIKTIVIENRDGINSERIRKVLAGQDLTIEHNCVGHAIYTQLYKQRNQLVITHCNRGNGQRAHYNLVYRINIAGLDLDELKRALETITGLQVKEGNDKEYNRFYDQYDKTLKDLGCSFSPGTHVKSQKIGNCVLANLKGLLKERLPEAVYKWCSTEIRNLSTIQHLINPLLQSGKDLKNKRFNIDTNEDFFHLRQLINYIFDKSVEGLVNGYFNNPRKSETLKKAFKAIGIYEAVINENKNLSSANKAAIKNYIHSKIDIYKKITTHAPMRKPGLFYQVLWNEADRILSLSSVESRNNEFFKHLINRAARNPNFFSDIYDYFKGQKKEHSGALLKLVVTESLEIIRNDYMLNDPEHTALYQRSLQKILLKECEKDPCDQELVTLFTNIPLTAIDPTFYTAASAAMDAHKNEDNKYKVLKLFLDAALNNSEFLDLFVRKRKSPVSTFFAPIKQAPGGGELSSFFKAAAKFIIDNTEWPLTPKKLQQNIEQMFSGTVERAADKNKVKRFLELFCYKQLLDSKKINEKNISHWANLNVLANQCKQISYCLPDALVITDSILNCYRKLKNLPSIAPSKQAGKALDEVQSICLMV